MSEISRESNLALFIDFDNVALGARDSRQRFDVRLLMQRVLEKGKIVVKRAYADWHFYKEHMTPLHEAAIELIEVPTPKISGKNSADIRLVVDAIDLCYAKSHIDTFVIVSGDSDFSPLVSKLRENDKRVIGIGVRSSSSHLLIANCDEFIFYDDIYHSAVNKLTETVSSVPQDKRRLFEFLLQTTQSLLQESRGVLYSSLIKDTMKRKQPEFNEANYGYTTFGELLEDARDQGLLDVERDNRAGGTLVVLGLGKVEVGQELPVARAPRRAGRRRSRKKTRLPAGAGPSAAAPAGKPETAASAAGEAAAAEPP
ncbi:MAG: NYN domain-containing protein, partial [Candidatus Krumholzibacteria bacterium]|nr:NYN domain-containing protein [Candidatus Krumholzibacteria bacterium]